MKKLIILIAAALVMAVSFNTQAQTSVQMINPSGVISVPDTFANAGTMSLTSKLAGPGIVHIQLDATKVSGTVNAYAVIETSTSANANPTSYAPKTKDVWGIVDTFTIADAAGLQSKQWDIPNHSLYYRVRLISPSGTFKVAPKAYIYAKP